MKRSCDLPSRTTFWETMPWRVLFAGGGLLAFGRDGSGGNAGRHVVAAPDNSDRF